ncbi:MAG TPA: helix-turn-helix domain-containing protein [Longimicrobiales bacterium]|nr:helix-turn-helix domain-containing protein [Longimicrobiales bacterium]
MANPDWRHRLLGSTRGQVVALLRRSAQTVSELAERLGLTDNAVRLHLSVLERDGLIEQEGTRREWTGKPAVLYRSTPEAEALFPKPYPEVLGELLTLLAERYSREEVEALLRDAGARLCNGGSPGKGLRHVRFAHAAEVLTALGGLAEVEEVDGVLLLQGYSCPLGAVTQDHPEVCQLAESLVASLVGEPVKECCDRGERPRCAFRPALGAAEP